MTLGKRIKELREKKGYTQRALADLLSIGNSTLAMYEVDKREPDNDTLSKIADFFGVSTDYLLGRNTPPARPSPTQEEKEEIKKEMIRLWDLLPEDEKTDVLRNFFEWKMRQSKKEDGHDK